MNGTTCQDRSERPRREAADDERDRPHHRYADGDPVHRRKSCDHRRVRVLTPGGVTAWGVEAGCD
ncbi:MAG TPA: hypothetical protein VE224_09665 [Pseudolabrys sp.]|nr:hypothetical protein [Pseudolabrys sp.]